MTTAHIPFREVPYLPQKLEVERRADGSILLRNGYPLRPYPPHMLAPLVYWGGSAPDRVWLAQRDPVDPSKLGWVTLTYGDALRRIRALAQGFLDQGVGSDAPVAILSRNSIEHALVMYAAMWAGAPVVPITPAYATKAKD
ncbi:MAG: AMP-binding protein, partial [Pseudomonadota bacterium]